MQEVIIYTKENCPYCVMAKKLLEHKGITNIREIKIDVDAASRDKMIDITGRRTVPQIFIGDTHVGGFDDLSALEHAGKLAELLN